MPNDTALMDSGSEAAQGAVQGETAPDTQASEAQPAAAAPEGTPVADKQPGTGATEQLATLEKRIRDAEAALKDKQRELHETTGALKEAREAANRNLGPTTDPAAVQKQREDFLQKVDANPRAAVEWFESVIAGQHQFIEAKAQELQSQLAQLREESDPVVQKNRDAVDKLMTDPDFKGFSRAQVARLYEKFRTPAATSTPKPPPAPSGAQRVTAPKQQPSVLSPDMLAFVRQRVSKKQDISLI